jgi:hypothetical protein
MEEDDDDDDDLIFDLLYLYTYETDVITGALSYTYFH